MENKSSLRWACLVLVQGLIVGVVASLTLSRASASIISATVNAADVSTSTSYCGSEESYPVKVKSVDIDPNPVVSGKPATFKISATSQNAISGGKLTIEVIFYGIRVHTESHDLCAKTTCPIDEGNFILTNSQSLPVFTPPGSYRLRMKMTDTDNKLLTCIYINFSIVRGNTISET
uniref:TSA: Wollemia nobilis Ref_Wollemi_Transcript_28759_990 transcribed RNA sequence n=1 Tax=Wollemia nobilis TaxID=56998 RepID=A0A0C9RPN7_9CONI